MRKLVLVVVSMLLIASSLLAQSSRTVSGKVIDEAGNAMPGVSVSLPGGKTGTVTNNKGEFSLSVPDEAKTLKVSFVGYEAKTLVIKGSSVGTVALTTDSKAISEVVVVGYGTQRKKDVTGSISSVKGGSVAELPVQSFEAGLGGRAAGVQITVPNGIVNNPPVFRIRGSNSISMSAYPLIVIDGVPTFSGDVGTSSAPLNPLSSINPSDIESIDIAKDAAATAIYGSRAANGVVFVTTKKGKAGRPKVSYDGWVGFTKPTRLPAVLNTAQYLEVKNEALTNAGSTDRYVENKDANGNTIDTKWMDVVYRSRTVSQSHNVNVSGGTENSSYYFSAGYTKQEGILKRNDFARKNLLFNIDQRLGKVASIGAKVSYSNEQSLISGSSGSLEGEAFNSGGLARLAFLTTPLVAPYNNDGTYNVSGSGLDGGKNTLPVGIYNPKILLDLDHSNTEANHVQGNVYLQVKPFEWMTLKTQYGADFILMNNDLYQNNIQGDARSSSGDASSIYTQYKRWVWTNTAQLDRTFGKHALSLLVGSEQQRDARERYGLERQKQMDNYFNNTEGGWLTDLSRSLYRRENYLLSAFTRLNYNYKEKYYLSANVRQDQYSAFGPNHKKGVFYGFSAGWEITKEAFWANSGLDHVFSSFKIRASHGKVGNSAGLGDYDALSLYKPIPYGGSSSLYFNQAGNPDLSWETSKKTDVGFSFGLLNNRISGEVSYYNTDINGLILFVPQMPSAGIPTIITTTTTATIPSNVGRMFNKGVEFSINAGVIAKKDFTWNASFNIAYNKNEITALAGDLTSIPFVTSSLEQTSINKVGYSSSMLYVVRTAGVDPATGRRIFINGNGDEVYFSFSDAVKYKYADGKPANAVGVKDAIAYKNTNPKFLGGLENTFRYKAFELNVLLTYQTGFYVYYGSNAGLRDQRYWNNSTDVLHRWQKAGDQTDMPRLVYGDNISNGSSFALASNVFKGDFVKLSSVGLTYRLPEKLAQAIHMSGAKVYVRGQNLALITKYPGPDPEVSSNGNNASGQGVDRNTLGNGRTMTVGLNVNF
ncbi:TonB-linked SusC/RagA family outer membrane protein [Chitinophaga niastensis]|uniref:TonB-linked SusC/RagA family outer membrane protein n=1 Tax=Chitinophaga niastensis TaxID=536980 RepID=A0A2P8HVN3_CHINA|nr:TonB-dependent receptor [Chitinophaga niastensis]PSL50276.1 TonB-linked SusC/RagA family outer membrane protein [Chitinophaga niastensis]